MELKGWTGGLNREADPYQLADEEVPDCLNVDFGLRGAVSKRKGYSPWAEHDTPIFKLVDWGDRIVAVDTSGNVLAEDDGELVDSNQDLTAPSTVVLRSVAYAAMNDAVYITQRSAISPLKWDGSTWSTLTHTTFDGTDNRFPRARCLVAAHSRFFAGNVDDGSKVHGSRVYWSDALKPETWQALSWIDFAPDDGTEITGMIQFGEQVIVFKERSIHALSGTDEDTFTVFTIDPELGTSCPGTITNVGPQLFFFDHLTGVHVFDGSAFHRKDDKINTYLLDGVNEAHVHKAVGFAYRGRWYLSVPWGTDQENSRTFVYDPRIDAWTEYDFGFQSAALYGATPLGASPRGAPGIFKLFDGRTDDGDPISAYFKTGWLAPTTPSVKHRIRRLDLTMAALGPYGVTVRMRRDFGQDVYREKVVDTDPGGALYGTAIYGVDKYGLGSEQVLSRTTGWGDRWRVCQFEFREDTDGEFQVNRMTIQTSSLRRTRGAH